MATTIGFSFEGVTAVEATFALPQAVRRSAQAMSDATMLRRRTWADTLNRVIRGGYESAGRLVWVGGSAAA